MSIWKQKAEQFKVQGRALAGGDVEAAAVGLINTGTGTLPPVVHMAVGGIAPPALAASAALDADTGEVLTANPAAPVAVAQSAEVLSAPMLGKQTVLVNVPAGETPFEIVPAQPTAEPAAAPRGRGRPAGAKNKAKAPQAGADVSGSVDAVADAPGGGIISEIAARALLNTPLPPGAVPAMELARLQALAGGDAPEPQRPIMFHLSYHHYPDPYQCGLRVELNVPRADVAAAAEAIDAFVKAVFPTPEST